MESWYWKSWGQEWVNIMEHSVDHKNSATRQPGVSCSFVGRQLKDLTATTTSKSFWKGCTWTMKKYPKIALSALSALSHPSNHGWWRFQVELVPSTSASCNSPCALHCIRHLESVRQIYYTRIILLYIYTCKCICYIYICMCVCMWLYSAYIYKRHKRVGFLSSQSVCDVKQPFPAQKLHERRMPHHTAPLDLPHRGSLLRGGNGQQPSTARI